jgi:hypothetical protein
MVRIFKIIKDRKAVMVISGVSEEEVRQILKGKTFHEIMEFTRRSSRISWVDAYKRINFSGRVVYFIDKVDIHDMSHYINKLQMTIEDFLELCEDLEISAGELRTINLDSHKTDSTSYNKIQWRI